MRSYLIRSVFPKCIYGNRTSSISSSASRHSNQEAAVTNSPQVHDQLTVDVERIFTSRQVQSLLRNLTGLDVNKVFRKRQAKYFKRPYFQLLTDVELEEFKDESKNRAARMLQMPPYMKPRSPLADIISYEPELRDFDKSKFIFTDITFGVTDRERLVVVRETDGTLRRATWDERDKMNRIYFHTEGKPVKMPRIFMPEYLRTAFDDGKHEFVLDYACHYFEPDDPDFIRVMESAWDDINNRHAFDVLYSTRYYGGLVFHLAVRRNIDDVLIYLSDKNRYANVVDLLRLFYLINGGFDISTVVGPEEELALLKHYAVTDSKKRPLLESTLNTMRQRQAEARRNAAQAQN